MQQDYLFTLPNQEGTLFYAKEHLPLVVYFYPRDHTPGCTLEGQEFSAQLDAFKQLGFRVVGISRDSVASHQKFCIKQGFVHDLLADVDASVCRQFDVIKEKNMYGKKVMGIERSTFVLDETGKIIHEWRKVKAAGHAEQVLAFLQNDDKKA